MRYYKLSYREVYQMTNFEHQEMLNAMSEEQSGTKTFKTEDEYIKWLNERKRRNSKAQGR